MDERNRIIDIRRRADEITERIRELSAQNRGTSCASVELADLHRALELKIKQLDDACEALRVQGEHLREALLIAESNRHRYEELFEQAPEPHLVVNLQGLIQEANPAALALFGVTDRSLGGTPLSNRLTAPAKAIFRTALARVAQDEDGVPETLEVLRSHDGESCRAELRMRPVRGIGGRVVGARCVLQVVSPGKDASPSKQAGGPMRRRTKFRRWLDDRQAMQSANRLVVAGSGLPLWYDASGVAATLRREFKTDRIAAYFRQGDEIWLWTGPDGSPDSQRRVPLEDVPPEIRDTLLSDDACTPGDSSTAPTLDEGENLE